MTITFTNEQLIVLCSLIEHKLLDDYGILESTDKEEKFLNTLLKEINTHLYK